MSVSPVAAAVSARHVGEDVGSPAAVEAATTAPRGPSRLGSTVARIVVAVVAATFVALNDELGAAEIGLFAGAVTWLAVTATVVMRHGWNPTQARAVALVDLGILLATAAITGASASSAIPVLWLGPVAWAAVADPLTARLMLGVAAMAFVGLWLPSALDHDPDAFVNLATFAGMYLGSTAIGLVALHLRGQTADRVSMLARTRAALVRELGQVEHAERERLSMRLHDGPLQMVISARQDLEEYRDGDAESLELSIETLDQSIQALRIVMGDLYPDHDTGTSVRERLETVARRHEARGHFRVELNVDDRLAGTTDDILVDMAGELMANVAKHAHASVAYLSALLVGGRAVIEVADDGVGMTPADRLAAECDGHIGLRSLDRRVRAIGGQWRIRSAPGRGTIVRVELPR